jgi:hypothetical protein
MPIQQLIRGEDTISRLPKYFYQNVEDPPGSGNWRITRGPLTSATRVPTMDYGAYDFLPFALVVAVDISSADHDYLVARSVVSGTEPVLDVYVIPENLDQNVSSVPQTQAYFEAQDLPTNWLTASSTYREMVRRLAAVVQFSKRYRGESKKVPWDTNQGTISYDGTTLTDSGQDFSEWETLTEPAVYLAAMEYERTDRTGKAYGYLGASTGGTVVNVYRDMELTVPGWNAMAPDAGSPIAYAVGWARGHLLFEEEEVDMDTKFRNFPVQVQTVFSITVGSFGYDPGIIKPNNDIRQMLNAAGSAWTMPFVLGPIQF